MTDQIIWEEPPETATYAGQKTGAYKEFADALRKAPGRWAIMPGERKTNESAKGTAQNVRRGAVKGFTKGEFETAVDETKIYVRFIGKVAGSESDEPDGEVDETPDSKKIRAWGRANNFDLPDRGRIPADVHEAYRRAHVGFERQPEPADQEDQAAS